MESILGKRNAGPREALQLSAPPKRRLLLLEKLLEAGKTLFPDLSVSLDYADTGEAFLLCSRKDLHNHPPIGMVHSRGL